MQHKTQSWAGPIIFMLQKNGWQTKQKRSKIIEKKRRKAHTRVVVTVPNQQMEPYSVNEELKKQTGEEEIIIDCLFFLVRSNQFSLNVIINSNILILSVTAGGK